MDCCGSAAEYLLPTFLTMYRHNRTAPVAVFVPSKTLWRIRMTKLITSDTEFRPIGTFLNPDKTREWRQVQGRPPGQEESIIFRDEKTGTYARLLRYEPGYKGLGVSDPMVHDFDEVAFIIQGANHNARLGLTYEAGSLAYFPAGTYHGPLASPTGGMLIEFRYYR